MTFKKFIGILGFILAIAVAGSSSYFLADLQYVDTVFYSRLFVLLISSLLAGWLIGEGFDRKVSFRLGLLGMLLGVAGALGHEMLFVERKISDTAQFRFMVMAVINGLIVSSFVLFGRNSSALRFAGDPEEEGEDEETSSAPGAESGTSGEVESGVTETPADEPAAEPQTETEVVPEPEEVPQVVAVEPLPEKGEEKDDADSEKDAIFEATLFEKNAELMIERAKLEADKMIFAAEQELQRITQEKEKVENELKLLVRTEKQLLEQYRERQ